MSSRKLTLVWHMLSVFLAGVMVMSLIVPSASMFAQESTPEPLPPTDVPAELPPTLEPLPTATPIPLPLPPDAQFLYSDFNTGDLTGWLLSAGWELQYELGNGFLATNAPSQSATVNGVLWEHFMLSAQIGITQGNSANIGFRVGAENYTLEINAVGDPTLYRNGVLVGGGIPLPPIEGATPTPPPPFQWHAVSITAIGGEISIRVNGMERISFVDEFPLMTGLIVFSTGIANTGAVRIDDVAIQMLPAPIPTLEPTDEPTEEPTLEPTDEPTETPTDVIDDPEATEEVVDPVDPIEPVEPTATPDVTLDPEATPEFLPEPDPEATPEFLPEPEATPEFLPEPDPEATPEFEPDDPISDDVALKIGTTLTDLLTVYLIDGAEAAALDVTEFNLLRDEAERLELLIWRADEETPAGEYIALIETLGGEVLNVQPFFVQAYVPLAGVLPMAALDIVAGITFPTPPLNEIPAIAVADAPDEVGEAVTDGNRDGLLGGTSDAMTTTSDDTGDGVRSMTAATGTITPHTYDLLSVESWHNVGATGSNVRIALIDVGFELGGSAADRACILFPNQIWNSSGTSNERGTSSAGIQAAEVICDIAPNAQVLQYRASDASQVRQAINAARTGGYSSGGNVFPPADIIVVGVVPTGTDANLPNAINNAFNANVPVIVAAGDSGNNQQSTFQYTPGGTTTVSIFAQSNSTINVASTGPGTNLTTSLSLNGGNWSQNAGVGQNVSYPTAGSLGGGGCDLGGCFFTLTISASVTTNITVTVSGGDGNGSVTPDSTVTPLNTGTLSVVANQDNVISVGAVCAHPNTRYPIYANSSTGPTGQDNNMSIRPSLVAPGNVRTSILSGDPSNCAGSTFSKGTRFAASHVAGMTALLFSNPQMQTYFRPNNPPQALISNRVRQYLMTRTIDVNSNGFDNVYGAGVAQLGDPAFNFGFQQTLNREASNFEGATTAVYVSSATMPMTGEANGSASAPFTHPAHALEFANQNPGVNTVILMPGEYVTSFRVPSNITLASFNSVDDGTALPSFIWVNDQYYGTRGGVNIADATNVTVSGFRFTGATPIYQWVAFPNLSLSRLAPFEVFSSSNVTIADNRFTRFDAPADIRNSQNVIVRDNRFSGFNGANLITSGVALRVFDSGTTNEVRLIRNLFENNTLVVQTANRMFGAVGITRSGVSLMANQFRNNTTDSLIYIDQWINEGSNEKVTSPIRIFSNLFQNNTINGPLVHLYQGPNFYFSNNTVVNHTSLGVDRSWTRVYIALGMRVGGGGTSTAQISDHRFDIHNNLFYNNEVAGGLLVSVSPAASPPPCTSPLGLGTGFGAQNNWFAAAGFPGGMCDLTTAGQGNLISTTVDGVSYDLSDPDQRAAFEELVFFTNVNDPQNPFRLRPDIVGGVQINPGVDRPNFGAPAVTPDSLVLNVPGLLTSANPATDPNALDVIGEPRFFNQATQAFNRIDVGAYETGNPPPVRFVATAEGDSIPPASPGILGYKSYQDGTGNFTFVGVEDQIAEIDLRRYLVGGYRPYQFNVTTTTPITNLDINTPCGGALFSLDQATGILTVCPPPNFHNYDIASNPLAELVFNYDATGLLNTGNSGVGQLTVRFVPVKDNDAPRDANAAGERQFIVTDINTPVSAVLAPNPDFEAGFILPDPDDVDYPFVISNIQVDFDAPDFTRELFEPGLTNAQINTVVQNAFDSTTGRFNWTPRPGVIGRFEFTYTVTSGVTRTPPTYTTTVPGVTTVNARRAQVRILDRIATPGIYDDVSLNLLYSGNSWRPVYLDQPDVFNATLHRAESGNQNVAMVFVGDAFVVGFRGGPTTGGIQFEIDANDSGQFLPLNHPSLENLRCSILNKPTTVPTQRSTNGLFVFGCQGLEDIAPNQLRVLRMTTASSARVNLDYIQIRGRNLTPGFYNNNDVALVAQRTGQWQTVQANDALGESLVRSDTEGSTISFRIDGNQVHSLAIYHTVNPAHGRMRVLITGMPPFTVDTGDTSQSQRSQPFVVTNIPPGPRTVQITNLSSNRVVIEGVELFGQDEPLTPGLYNSHDPGIRYIGPWNERINDEAMFGNFWLNLDRRGSAVFEIDGDGIVLYHTMNADRDFFEVCFNADYANCTIVSAQVGARWFSNRQVISAPSFGRHTVEIRSANDSAFSIEAIEVLGQQQPLLPGYYEEDNSQMRYQGYWRPRLSLQSLGNNIQVAETGGTVSFLVDAAQFSGFRFYYRGGPEYGQVQVCREGGGCTSPFNQFRSSRQDGLFREITRDELTMPEAGIHRIIISRPSGEAFINIEAMEILGAMGPGFYNDRFSGLNYTGNWNQLPNSGTFGQTVTNTSQANATMQFQVNGDTVDTLVIHRTLNPPHGSMRIQVNGTPPSGGASSTYVNRVFSNSDVAVRQFTQPAVITNIGPGLQTVTVTNVTGGRITQIEAVQLVGSLPVLTPGLYNSHDPQIEYIGIWNNRDNDEAMFGNFWLNLNRSGSAVFEIDGDGIVLYHTMNADRDFFEVCFNADYDNCTIVSAQVGTRWFSNRQVISAPSFGRHTVEIRSANDSAFSIEAIEVLGQQQPLLPGYYEEDNSQMRYQGYWRPRLSLLSLGNNIQVAETGGTVSFLVDAAQFSGFGFYYRGGPEYGQVRVCREGGSCVTFNQNRSNRQDSLLRLVTASELGMPASGIQRIVIDRPSGNAFVNIEGLEIVSALGPGLYQDFSAGLVYAGNWVPFKNVSGPLGGSFTRATTNGASLTMTVDGDTVNNLVIYHTMNNDHGSMRIRVNGSPPGGGGTTEYVNRVVDVNSVNQRFWSQAQVITNIGPGLQTITITSQSNSFLNIEAIELFGETPVIQPGLYNSHDPNLRFVGNWQERLNDEAMFGNFWLNLDRRVSLVFEIDGDGVVIYHTMNADRDSFEVCFNGDSSTCAIVEAQVGARWFSNRQVISAPSFGRHTVEVRSLNQSAFSIEAIEVLGQQQPLLPGYYEEDNSQMRYQGYWRPRLSLQSLGNNIQVAETGGTVSFLVDASNFQSFGFYYRGGPEYGQARVCREGGGCVTFNQNRSSRQDGLLRVVTAGELTMPATGIHRITIDRPSGNAFINIEAMTIVPQTPIAVGPGYYEQDNPNFSTTGTWTTLSNVAFSNNTILRTTQSNAEFRFTIGGGETAADQVTGFTVFTTQRTTPTTFDICYRRQSTNLEQCRTGFSTQSPISMFITPYGHSIYGLFPLALDGVTNETYIVRVIQRGSGPLDIDAIGVYGNFAAPLAENTPENPFYNDNNVDIVYPFAWSRTLNNNYRGGSGAFVEIAGVPQQIAVDGSTLTLYIPVGPNLSNRVRLCVVLEGALTPLCATFSQNNPTSASSIPMSFFGLGSGTKQIIIENLDGTRRAVIEAIVVQ